MKRKTNKEAGKKKKETENNLFRLTHFALVVLPADPLNETLTQPPTTTTTTATTTTTSARDTKMRRLKSATATETTTTTTTAAAAAFQKSRKCKCFFHFSHVSLASRFVCLGYGDVLLPVTKLLV